MRCCHVEHSQRRILQRLESATKVVFYMVGKGVKKAGLANIRRFRCLHCCLGLCKQEFIVAGACFIHIINLHYFRMKTR